MQTVWQLIKQRRFCDCIEWSFYSFRDKGHFSKLLFFAGIELWRASLCQIFTDKNSSCMIQNFQINYFKMELAFLKSQFWGRIIFYYICDWWMKLNFNLQISAFKIPKWVYYFVDLLCLCYFMILRKSKQNAQKSKIVVGLVLKWLPVRFGKS